jgi:hypothetical protein
MQSLSRKQDRIDLGIQNQAPRSTKISKYTSAGKLGGIAYRKGRFI